MIASKDDARVPQKKIIEVLETTLYLLIKEILSKKKGFSPTGYILPNHGSNIKYFGMSFKDC